MPGVRALRFRQHLRYKSREWQTVYGMLWNCVEGFNGTVKDGRGAALSDQTRRRVRGIAPQWLLCTFLLVGENLRRIRRWQDESDTDRHGRMAGPVKVARGARRADDIARWEAEVDERVAQGLPIRSPLAEKRDRKRRRRKPKPPGTNG